MSQTRRQLSSTVTASGIQALLVVWLLVLGPITLLLFVSDNKDKWGILPVWVVVIILSYLRVGRYKTVVLEKHFLYISDLRHTIQVPASEIVAVDELIWFRNHPIRIEFKHPTRFGKSITFTPYYRFHVLPYYSHHPVAADLRKLAGLPRDGHD